MLHSHCEKIKDKGALASAVRTRDIDDSVLINVQRLEELIVKILPNTLPLQR